MIRLKESLVDQLGFMHKKIRETSDIEVLRKAYEELLKAYKDEIKKRVHLEMKLEELELNV